MTGSNISTGACAVFGEWNRSAGQHLPLPAISRFLRRIGTCDNYLIIFSS